MVDRTKHRKEVYSGPKRCGVDGEEISPREKQGSVRCRAVCVTLYFYPAACGPEGHGSGPAAA